MKASTFITLVVLCFYVTGCTHEPVAPSSPGMSISPDVNLAKKGQVISDVTGDWFGFFGLAHQEESQTYTNNNGGTIIDSELNITDQRRRRFSGTMDIDGNSSDMSGTLSNSGIVNLVLEGVGTSPGAAKGQYVIDTFDNNGMALLRGDLRSGSGKGSTKGTQVLLRHFDFDFNVGTPPDLGGEWEGTLISAVDQDQQEITGKFGHVDNTNRFKGTFSFLGDDSHLEGSIDNKGNIGIVAMGTRAGIIIVFEGTHILEEIIINDDVGQPVEVARIDGSYIVWCAISPNMLLDSGTFDITQILVGL